MKKIITLCLILTIFCLYSSTLFALENITGLGKDLFADPYPFIWWPALIALIVGICFNYVLKSINDFWRTIIGTFLSVSFLTLHNELYLSIKSVALALIAFIIGIMLYLEPSKSDANDRDGGWYF